MKQGRGRGERERTVCADEEGMAGEVEGEDGVGRVGGYRVLKGQG